jgi:hypothetical protein
MRQPPNTRAPSRFNVHPRGTELRSVKNGLAGAEFFKLPEKVRADVGENHVARHTTIVKCPVLHSIRVSGCRLLLSILRSVSLYLSPERAQMQARKLFFIGVGSLVGLIVIAAFIIVVAFFGMFRGGRGQNFVRAARGQQTISPVGDIAVYSQVRGSSSYLYRKDPVTGTNERLTTASRGIESEASFSRDGKLVVYSFATAPDSRSAVWVVSEDGRNSHPLTSDHEDSLHPVFAPDGSKVFYAVSRLTGNYSPIVRPARHDWDVYTIPVESNAASGGVLPAAITHASFYDLRSIDVVDDPVKTDTTKLLVSTTGYPIGALLEEFTLGDPGRNKIFQPHVPGEPSMGPSYGEARFIHNGMDILFLAASAAAGDYDYNVYSMSDVTGGDIKQLTHLKGMTTDLKVLPDGKAMFVNGGVAQTLDLSTNTAKPL